MARRFGENGAFARFRREVFPLFDPDQTLRQAMELHTGGRVAEAAALYRQVLTVLPESADAHYLLGVAAQQQGDFEGARSAIENSIRLNPGFASAHSALSVVRLARGDLEGAARSAERAVALTPEAADVHFNHANALRAAGRLEAACEGYRRALAINGDYAAALNNLGVTLERLGRMDRAREVLGDALRAAPDDLDARNNLGKILYLSGDLAAAEAAFDEVLRHQPGNALATLNRGMLDLLRGRFAEGWPRYEARVAVAGAGIPQLPGRPWEGEPLAGMTLLLHGEQGLGDTLQFIRYLPRIVADGGRVLLLVQRPLVSLLEGIDGVARVIADGEPLPPYDRRAALPSLPRIFATDEATIPARLPYLAPPAAPREVLARVLGETPSPRVGLVWAGNPGHDNDHNRSIPPEALAGLTAREGVSWISLQKGEGAARTVPPGMTPVGGLLEDFADTAAVVARLDLVITVDTAVAHLAGALGRPVWLLLPLVPDWRWMVGRDDSPWYPGVMRLFRQQRFGDWPGVIEKAAEALDDWLVGRSAERSAQGRADRVPDATSTPPAGSPRGS